VLVLSHDSLFLLSIALLFIAFLFIDCFAYALSRLIL